MKLSVYIEILRETGRRLAEGVRFKDLGQLSLQLIGQKVGMAVVELWVSDGGRRLSMLCASDGPEPRSESGSDGAGEQGLQYEAHRTAKTVYWPKIEDDSRHRVRSVQTQSALSVPLVVRGLCHGVLHLESRDEDRFEPQEILVLEALASILSTAVHSQQLNEQTQRSEEYLQAVLRASQDIAIISTDTQGYIITCSEGTERIFDSNPAEMRGRDLLTLYSEESLVRGIHDFINGRTPDSVFKKDVTELARGSQSVYLSLRLHKVRNQQSNLIGFLCITRDITETVELEKKLFELSITDELTGLYNQREFFNQLGREIEKFKRTRDPLALCFFDLDNFKGYNDSLGHLRGDQALKEVAQCIRGSVRKHLDLAFRYGGDEFTIIMAGVTPPKAALIAERIRKAVERHFRGGITLSIGITSYVPEMSARQFVHLADNGMYDAKTKGGNQIVIV